MSEEYRRIQWDIAVADEIERGLLARQAEIRAAAKPTRSPK